MRIARFSAPATGGEPRFGVVTGELDEYGQLPDETAVVELVGDPLYAGLKPTQTEHLLGDLKLLAPVIPRSKVVAIGHNYAAHAAEMDFDVPEEPMMFLKPNTSVVGPGDQILYPAQSRDVHFEGELAVVIGRMCRDVPADQATDVIFGYTIGNDVTARDLQRQDVQFTRGKGFDSFCPLGPWIEVDLDPHDFTADGGGRRVQTHLNGELEQDGDTRDLIFDIPTLVAHITSVMTLLPGDVILTGTPDGVGPMEVGDEVEVSVAGIGSLTNTVATR